MKLKGMFLSLTPHWATPAGLYDQLDREFHFNFDPCPLAECPTALHGTDGLYLSWRGKKVFCNPPYGPGIGQWLTKGQEADLAVFLLPARTDTKWFHELALPNAREIRFIRGRLKFGEGKSCAPFPSMIVVFKSLPACGLCDVVHADDETCSGGVPPMEKS